MCSDVDVQGLARPTFDADISSAVDGGVEAVTTCVGEIDTGDIVCLDVKVEGKVIDT